MNPSCLHLPFHIDKCKCFSCYSLTFYLMYRWRDFFCCHGEITSTKATKRRRHEVSLYADTNFAGENMWLESLSLSHCVSISLSLDISLHLSHAVSLFFSLSLALSLSVTLSISLTPCIPFIRHRETHCWTRSII